MVDRVAAPLAARPARSRLLAAGVDGVAAAPAQSVDLQFAPPATRSGASSPNTGSGLRTIATLVRRRRPPTTQQPCPALRDDGRWRGHGRQYRQPGLGAPNFCAWHRGTSAIDSTPRPRPTTKRPAAPRPYGAARDGIRRGAMPGGRRRRKRQVAWRRRGVAAMTPDPPSRVTLPSVTVTSPRWPGPGRCGSLRRP